MIATSAAPSSIARRLALGLTTALVCVVPVASATAATVAAPSGTGITLPTGIAQSADTSSVWVSDGLLGVCRVTLATPSAPAAIVQSPYCRREVAVENEEAPAPERAGPSGAGPMAYDPISANLFVAEGTSKGAGVWRMQLNAAGTAIQSAEKIVNLGANRLTGLALSPAGDLDFTAKDDAVVRRLAGAAAALPGAPVTVVGAAGSDGVPSLTHLGEALYLADGGNVTRIATPGAGNTNAVVVANLGAGAPSALAADQSRGLVFAGTAMADTVDRVEVLTPGGAVETYAVGFAGVSALTVTADGTMFIGDDPAAAAGHPESSEQGRIFVEGRHATGLVQVTFTAQPDPYSSSTTATFAYRANAGAAFSCRFDMGVWQACESSSTFTGLGDGAHTFEVLAVSGGEPGPVARVSFVVDTRAPETVQIDNAPSDQWITTASLRLRFSTDEQFVRYACTLDGAPIFACDSPSDLRDLSLGEHEVVITATDLAGNMSLPRTWRFTRSLPPAPPAADPPADVAPVAAAAPAAPAETAAGATVVPSATPAGAPDCRPVRAPTSKGRYAITKDARALIATLPAPRFARFAKITLRKRGATGPVQTIATRRVTAGRTHTLRVTLTSSQAQRLRSGRYRLDAAFGTCATTVGVLRELAPARAMKPRARIQKAIR